MGAVVTTGFGDLAFNGSVRDTIVEEKISTDEAVFLMEEETDI